MKKIYTTGEVAKLLGININTVIKWFDDGKIEGFRLPGSRERRITHNALLQFMNGNNIPLELIQNSSPDSDRRKNLRHDANLSVKLILDDKKWTGNIKNISEKGALILLPNDLGHKFRFGDFNLEMNFLGKPLSGMKTTASIANVRPQSDQIELGVEFDPKDRKLRNLIKQVFNAA